MVRKRIHVEGMVQGVSYRASAYDEAVRLGIHGWVRNRRDGRVEALVEGDPENVAAFIEWCKKGPPSSNVTGVDVKDDASAEDLSAFEVRPTL